MPRTKGSKNKNTLANTAKNKNVININVIHQHQRKEEEGQENKAMIQHKIDKPDTH